MSREAERVLILRQIAALDTVPHVTPKQKWEMVMSLARSGLPGGAASPIRVAHPRLVLDAPAQLLRGALDRMMQANLRYGFEEWDDAKAYAQSVIDALSPRE